MPSRRTLIAGGTVLALVAALGAAQLAPGASPPAHAEGLVPYDSCNDLLSYYRDQVRSSATPWGFGYGYGGLVEGGGVAMAAGAPSTARMAAAAPQAAGAAADTTGSAATGMEAVGNGATGTNVQEQGVDEPDLAKLRDGRLVVLTGNRLRVVSAEAQPRLLGSLTMPGDQAYGGELLLVGGRAVVIGPGWRQDPRSHPGDGDEPRMLMPIRPGVPTAEVVLVDLTGDQPRLLERSTYDGQYVSARLVGGTLRLVTTTRPQPEVVHPTEPGPVAERRARAANAQAAAGVGLSDVLPQ